MIARTIARGVWAFRPAAAPAPPSSPIPTTDLVAWHRYEYLTASYSSGNSITMWNDESGQGNHLSNSFGNPPTYLNTSRLSRPCARFDGSNDRLTWPTSLIHSLHTSSHAEMFIVVDKPSQADTKGFHNLGGSTDYCLHTFTNQCIYEPFGVNSCWSTTALTANTLDNPFIYNIAAWTGSNTAYTSSINISCSNGDKVYKSIFDQPTAARIYQFNQAYRDLGYGYRGVAFTNAYFTGSVWEVIIYKRRLSTADRETVRAYLSTKYSIT